MSTKTERKRNRSDRSSSSSGRFGSFLKKVRIGSGESLSEEEIEEETLIDTELLFSKEAEFSMARKILILN